MSLSTFITVTLVWQKLLVTYFSQLKPDIWVTAELLRCCWEIWLPAAFINYVTFCSNHVYFLPTIHLFWLSVCANLARTSVQSKLQMRQVQSIKNTVKHSPAPSTNKTALLSLKLRHSVSDQEVCQRGGAARDTVFPVREQRCRRIGSRMNVYMHMSVRVRVRCRSQYQLWLLNTSSCLLAAQAQFTRVKQGRRRGTVAALPPDRRETQRVCVCVWGGVFVRWCVGGEMHEQPLQAAKSQALCGLKIVIIKPEC